MSHTDIEMPDAAIVAMLADVLAEARSLADLVVVRPHLNNAVGPWLQQVILGAINAHQAAEGAAVECDAPLIHRARMLGDYIWTATGGRFFPQDPKPEEVELQDIAHALAHTCRWTGHTHRLYTVGEHSLHVAEIAECLALTRAWRADVTPEEAVLYALLHDAHEAYLPDVARPVAHYMDAKLLAMATAVQEAIFHSIGILPPTQAVDSLVEEADAYALRLEAEALFTDQDPDEANCNLSRITVPLVIRNSFPVQAGAAPTCESIRCRWLLAIDTAIATARAVRPNAGTDTWQEAAAAIEMPEFCVVCSMTAAPGCAPRARANGLCAVCGV